MPTPVLNRVMELRLQEIDIRQEMIDCLRNMDATKEYKHAGTKTLREFCMKELGWSYDTIREVLTALGKIIPTEKLVARDPAASARLSALIQWRTGKRIESGVAAYQILPNRTMLEIADANPRSLDQLLGIKGVGAKKLEKFGSEVLEVLHRLN